MHLHHNIKLSLYVELLFMKCKRRNSKLVQLCCIQGRSGSMFFRLWKSYPSIISFDGVITDQCDPFWRNKLKIKWIIQVFPENYAFEICFIGENVVFELWGKTTHKNTFKEADNLEEVPWKSGFLGGREKVENVLDENIVHNENRNR